MLEQSDCALNISNAAPSVTEDKNEECIAPSESSQDFNVSLTSTEE